MTGLSYPADQVRRYDHDRFVTAIFATASMREHLFALYAFNIEIAKTGEVVSEPLIGQIRLQWWRDTLDRLYAGEKVAHAVAQPLGEAISATGLDRADFDSLIDAREFDLDRATPQNFVALSSYAEGTGAALVRMALRISAVSSNATSDEIARLVGTGWALTGLLRAVPFHARQRRLYLPVDMLEMAGVRASRLFDMTPEPGLREVVKDIADHASGLFDKVRDLSRSLPKAGRSPVLLASLGRLYLSDLMVSHWDPFVLEAKPPRRFAAARLALNLALNRL